jgi:MoaA/NifB/PqqE/SkfB family radical SAM enzyme
VSQSKDFFSLVRRYGLRVAIIFLGKLIVWSATYGRKFHQTYGKSATGIITFIKDEPIVKHHSRIVFNSQFPPIPSPAFDNMAFPKRQRTLEISRPLYPWFTNIAVTYDCPLNCWHCSARGQAREHADLSVEAWRSILRQLQDVGVFYFGITGGEPLQRPDLEEILEAIDGKSVIAMATSGVGMTSRRAQSLQKAGLYYLLVSLDHHHAEVHDRYRGYPGAYDAAIHAMHYAQQAGLYTIMQVAVTKRFVKEKLIWDMVRIGKEAGVQEIRLRGIIPIGRISHIPKGQLLDGEDNEILLSAVGRIRAEGGSPKISIFEDFESPDKFGCSAGSYHAYVDAGGNLCPCDFVPMHFGNLLEESFEQVWDRVRPRFGTPQKKCLACFVSDYMAQNGITTPISSSSIQNICTLYHTEELPGFFQ